MKESNVDGDHEGDNDQNTRNRQVGRVPGLSGRFGFSDFGKKPVAQEKRGHENWDRFKDRHNRKITPVDLSTGKQGHS